MNIFPWNWRDPIVELLKALAELLLEPARGELQNVIESLNSLPMFDITGAWVDNNYSKSFMLGLLIAFPIWLWSLSRYMTSRQPRYDTLDAPLYFPRVVAKSAIAPVLYVLATLASNVATVAAEDYNQDQTDYDVLLNWSSPDVFLNLVLAAFARISTLGLSVEVVLVNVWGVIALIALPPLIVLEDQFEVFFGRIYRLVLAVAVMGLFTRPAATWILSLGSSAIGALPSSAGSGSMGAMVAVMALVFATWSPLIPLAAAYVVRAQLEGMMKVSDDGDFETTTKSSNEEHLIPGIVRKGAELGIEAGLDRWNADRSLEKEAVIRREEAGYTDSSEGRLGGEPNPPDPGSPGPPSGPPGSPMPPPPPRPTGPAQPRTPPTGQPPAGQGLVGPTSVPSVPASSNASRATSPSSESHRPSSRQRTVEALIAAKGNPEVAAGILAAEEVQHRARQVVGKVRDKRGDKPPDPPRG